MFSDYYYYDDHIMTAGMMQHENEDESENPKDQKYNNPINYLQNDHFSMKTGRAFCDAQMESNNPFQEQCRCKPFYDPKTEDCPFFVGGCTDCGSDKSETISN